METYKCKYCNGRNSIVTDKKNNTVIIVAFIVCTLYLISILFYIAAIWVGDWRLTVTGILSTVVGFIINMVWGISLRGWQ